MMRLRVISAILLLTGCASPLARAPFVAPARKANIATGTMAFVATGSDVRIVSYPDGHLVRDLQLTAHTLCSDADGNVFVPTSDYQIREFSHLGDAIQTLQTGDVPLACAVDPVTGNLAVTNENSGAGEIAVFAGATGTPQFYRDPGISTYGQCGYDNKGNLYVAGTGSSAGGVFAELPKGSETFTNFTLDARFAPCGSVQWDGSHITLTDPANDTLTTFAFAKSLRVVGTTHFINWQNVYNGGWPYVQTWLKGHAFVAQASLEGRLATWKYPEGGHYMNRTNRFIRQDVNIYGVVLSEVPKR
jgi:DNA-binding beta-propeller fold protein YncE